MQVLSTMLVGLVALDASIFLALYFRRPRPELRARLFQWVLYSKADRQSRARRESHMSA